MIPTLGRHALVSIAAVGAAALALGACGGTPGAAPQVVSPRTASQTTAAVAACGGRPTITATATGQVHSPPDTLLLSLGVQVRAASARTALSEDDAKVAKLVGILRAAGVPAADIQTSNLSVGPNYGQKPAGVVTGYIVTNVVSATVTHLSAAGRILGDAAGAAGNGIQFDGVQYTLTNDTNQAIAARAQAVRRAEGRARAMAAAAGVTLGPLCSVSDGSASAYVAGGSGSASGVSSLGFSGSSGSAAPVPVEPGTQVVSAQVTVVYGAG